jgi:hypothetical protein
MTEAKQKLQAARDAVRMKAIGIQGGVYIGFTPIDVRFLEDAVVQFITAQALLDGLATTEEGIAIRDILVDQDFRDKNGNAIVDRTWVQPISGGWAGAQTGATANEVYRTNKDCDNTQKVYSFYGIRANGTGPGDTSSVLKSNSIQFQRSTVKIIDIWEIEALDTVPERQLFARTPLLYKKGDNASIWWVPRSSTVGGFAGGMATLSGAVDKIILLGKVAEPLGKTITG